MGANLLSMSSFPVFIVVLVSPVVSVAQVVEVAVAVAKVVVGR